MPVQDENSVGLLPHVIEGQLKIYVSLIVPHISNMMYMLFENKTHSLSD